MMEVKSRRMIWRIVSHLQKKIPKDTTIINPQYVTKKIKFTLNVGLYLTVLGVWPSSKGHKK